MARPKKVKEEPKASNLLEALKFISIAQHLDGTPMQTHCRIANGTVIGFDGGLAAGHFVDESLNVCPHTKTFIAALSKCTEQISITELDSGKLSVKSGKFRALVPCVPFLDLPSIEPDPPCATLSDSLKTALTAVLGLAQDGADEPFLAGVLLQAQTVVTTNKHVILEAFHGIDLPPDILLPKASAVAIAKSSKSLTSFGFSANSATFYFDDNSFIKSQLFVSNFPKYLHLLEIACDPKPLPEGFYDALDKVAEFSNNKNIYFIDSSICSHPNKLEGASFELPGLQSDLAFNIAYLKLIKNACKTIQFNVNSKGLALFFGENVRGGIMKVSVNGN